MRALIALLLYLFCPTGANAAGAVAYSESPSYGREYFFAIDYVSREAATKKVLDECQANHPRCFVLTTFSNSCVYSIHTATGDRFVAVAQGESDKTRILNACLANLFSCRVRRSYCDYGYERQLGQRAQTEQEQQPQTRSGIPSVPQGLPRIPADKDTQLELNSLARERDYAVERAEQAERELAKLQEPHPWLQYAYGQVATAKQIADRPLQYLRDDGHIVAVAGVGAFIAALIMLFGMRRETAGRQAPQPTFRAAAAKQAHVIAEPTPKPPKPVRDTARAVQALAMAEAYLDEIDLAQVPEHASDYLNTIALATKQIAIAEKADSDAALTLERDGEAFPKGIREFKAHALLYEGICYSDSDRKRAARVFEQAATIDPANPLPFYWLGLMHRALYNKRRAIAALEKAVELDPTDIEYHKALDRVRNMSSAEIAINQTFSMGRHAKRGAIAFLLLFLGSGAISLIATYGISNVAGAILLIIVVGVGAKVHQLMQRY